ncbi:hypothetical protein DFQ26_004882 [Actinomortierella ambigua]|nr:hypothetical protein DFQ26_004882 [Actinomortierella ambigua]
MAILFKSSSSATARKPASVTSAQTNQSSSSSMASHDARSARSHPHSFAGMTQTDILFSLMPVYGGYRVVLPDGEATH